jgi:hypothetical protein
MKIKSLLFAALAAGMCFSANAFGENDYIGLAEAPAPEAIEAAGADGLEVPVCLFDTDLYGYCRVLDGYIKVSEGLSFGEYTQGSGAFATKVPGKAGERIAATNELAAGLATYSMTTQFRDMDGDGVRDVQYLGQWTFDAGLYGETGGAIFYIKLIKNEGAGKESITFPTPVIATSSKFNDAGEVDPNGTDSFKPAEKVYEVDFTNPGSGVNDLGADKAVASVKYYNAAGVAADAAFDGVNIVVTKYVDGTQKVVKIVK